MATSAGKPGILAVGNFDSNVGYAWRLMERFWCELSSIGGERGYKTHICFPSVSEIPPCLKQAQCNVEKLDFTATNLFLLIAQIQFILRNNIKILYLTDLPTFSFRYVLFRLAGVRKIIVHDHTPGVRVAPKGLKKRLKQLANRLPLLSCTAAFAVSPYVGARLVTVNGVPKEKVYCVTNGIDLPENQETTGLPVKPKAPIQIITVGRVSAYKGIGFALRVIGQLVKDRDLPTFEYVIVGDGPDRQRFEQLAHELGVEDICHFIGNVNDVPERLEKAHIAFHPSKGEAMSLAILEYMRAGLGIVVSDNPSVNSALTPDEDALIYPEDDLEAATTAIKKLVGSEEARERLGLRARKNLLAHYSSQAMMERFRESLVNVLD